MQDKIKNLKKEIVRLRELARTSTGDLRKEMLALADDMERHVQELERAALRP